MACGVAVAERALIHVHVHVHPVKTNVRIRQLVRPTVHVQYSSGTSTQQDNLCGMRKLEAIKQAGRQTASKSELVERLKSGRIEVGT